MFNIQLCEVGFIKELVTTKVNCGIASLILCLGKKVSLEQVAKTTANGQLAFMFCICMRENNSPYQQVTVVCHSKSETERARTGDEKSLLCLPSWLRHLLAFDIFWTKEHLTVPGFEVVEQMITDFRLFLVELSEQVQQNREATVVFLHLTQVPEYQTHRLTHGILQRPISTHSNILASSLRKINKSNRT